MFLKMKGLRKSIKKYGALKPWAEKELPLTSKPIVSLQNAYPNLLGVNTRILEDGKLEGELIRESKKSNLDSLRC